MKAADIYKVIVENSRDGIAVIDNATGFFIEANKTFCAITDKEKNFLLSGKTVSSILPDSVPEADYKAYQKVLAGNADLFLRYYHFQQSTGGALYLKVQVTRVAAKGEGCSVLLLEDITESSYSNKKWKESELHFRHLFESSPVGLWEEDFSAAATYLESLKLIGLPRAEAQTFLEQHPDVILQCMSLVKIVDVNQVVLEQYRVTDKAHFLKHASEIIFTEESVVAAKSFLAAICSNADADMFEVAGTAVTGEKIYLQLKWNVTPGTGEYKYKRVILASIDITESKKTQKALEQASARLETIVDTIDGIVWTAHPETLNLNFISKSVQDITGYSSDQFLGREMYKFNFDFYADQKQMDRFRRKIMKGIPGTLEYPIKTKSGEEKWLQVNVSFIKEGEAVQLILGIVIDITMLKKSKNELNQSMKVLSDQNKRLLNFSYIVSHNLRSHSSNILSLCELINHTKDAEEKEGLIRLLGEVAKLLHNTMEGLNEVAGIQSSVAIPKEALNLRDYIDNCYYVLSDRITLKKFGL